MYLDLNDKIREKNWRQKSSFLFKIWSFFFNKKKDGKVVRLLD